MSATAGNPPSGLDSPLSRELPGLRRDDGRTRSGGGSFHHQSVGTEVCTRTRPTASTAFELDVDGEELGELWSVLELEEKTRVRDRTIISVPLHGLRASEASALNIGSWNGKILTVHRSKGQNVSEMPLGREARLHLEKYLESGSHHRTRANISR